MEAPRLLQGLLEAVFMCAGQVAKLQPHSWSSRQELRILEINELINNFHELCIQYIIFNCVCKSLTLMILMFSRSCLKRYENFNLKYFWACFGHVGRVVKSFLLRFGSMKTDWTLLTSLVGDLNWKQSQHVAACLSARLGSLQCYSGDQLRSFPSKSSHFADPAPFK